MHEVGNPNGRGLGQDALLDPLIAKLAPYAEKVGMLAAEKVKPMLEEKLQEYVPKAAIMTGLVTGTLVIIGLWVGKRYL